MNAVEIEEAISALGRCGSGTAEPVRVTSPIRSARVYYAEAAFRHFRRGQREVDEAAFTDAAKGIFAGFLRAKTR
jgi:hypothetical protein